MGAEPLNCPRCGQPSHEFGTDPLPPYGKSRTWTPEEYAAAAAQNSQRLEEAASGHVPRMWQMTTKGASGRPPTREELRRSGERAMRTVAANTAPAVPSTAEGTPDAKQQRFWR